MAHEVVFSGAAFTEGIESHRIEGDIVRIYTVAKTLADLFTLQLNPATRTV